MPKFKQEPDETFPDVYLVNDSGRVVAVPGGWQMIKDPASGRTKKSYDYPQVNFATEGRDGWRLATADEISATKAEDAKKAKADAEAKEARAAKRTAIRDTMDAIGAKQKRKEKE